MSKRTKEKGSKKGVNETPATSGEKRAWRTRHDALQSQTGSDFRGSALAKYSRQASTSMHPPLSTLPCLFPITCLVTKHCSLIADVTFFPKLALFLKDGLWHFTLASVLTWHSPLFHID